ncbi:MAG: hypothetical protein ACFFCS_24230 [Candidatus Hodarchaeota archaeon]
MQTSLINKLKLVYLVILIGGLFAAIFYGVQEALEVYFTERFPPPFGIHYDIYWIMRPISRFIYIYFSTLSFPMLVTIQNLQDKLMGTEDKQKTIQKFILKVIIENIGAILLSLYIIIVLDVVLSAEMKPFLWVYEVIIIVLVIIFSLNLPKIANTVNNDIREFHLWGYHLHESLFGIFFMIAALFFIFNANSNLVDLIFASFFLIMGGFLFGRDIKDVMEGKIIEKIKKEPEDDTKE